MLSINPKLNLKLSNLGSYFQKLTPLTRKMLNIGSILYHTIMIVLKSAVPSYQNNQSFLSLDLKVRPKKKLLQAIGNSHLCFILSLNP